MLMNPKQRPFDGVKAAVVDIKVDVCAVYIIMNVQQSAVHLDMFQFT